MHYFVRTPISLAVLATLAQFSPAFAEDAALPPVMQEIIVRGDKSPVPANLPSTTETISASQIAASVNAITSSAALNYLPSIHVRERYIGDRNAILVMRVNSSVSSAQTSVYADNMLLSNFLNNSFSTPPRWGMVAPEEIERIDVLYGPFSALFPGNSAGGVVLMTTHMPKQFEAHLKLDLFGQRFKLYGTDQHYGGKHYSAAIGNKSGDWSFWLTADHLDNNGHPQTFGAATKATPTGAPAYILVSGGYRDVDTGGKARIITSATGADHTVQDNAKLKLAYDISPSLRAMYTFGMWKNASDTTASSYLRDASGAAVYNTTGSGASRYVRFDGDSSYYTLAGTAPSESDSMHTMHGISLRSRTNGEWDWEALASTYAQDRERSRSTANSASLVDSGVGATRPAGTLTIGDGTGWSTIDFRGTWRPSGELKSTHTIDAGIHADRYSLQSVTWLVPGDWLYGAAAAPSSNSFGKTASTALYLQDAWKLATDWELIAGGRLEHWRAYDGSNFNAANASAYRQLNYAERSRSDFSPKWSLSRAVGVDWMLRAAWGKAVRYPTVAEIFQVISLPNNVKQNDPHLKPESVRSGELAVERAVENGLLRTSFFWEDKHDALISQTDTTVTPTVSSIQNVDRVRTHGLESVFALTDVLTLGLDLNASVTYTRSTIATDSRNPGLAGTDQPRIPDWRATLVGVYRASDRLSTSISYRFSGRQHNALFNTTTNQYNDTNPNVYGAVSHYSVVDVKLLYKLAPRWSASFGINNLGAFKYYVNPNPYPQRTFFTSVKFDY